jgi:hypothetical protein
MEMKTKQIEGDVEDKAKPLAEEPDFSIKNCVSCEHYRRTLE